MNPFITDISPSPSATTIPRSQVQVSVSASGNIDPLAPKTPELSDSDIDPSERIATLKDRLKSLSTKHAPKRASLSHSLSYSDIASSMASTPPLNPINEYSDTNTEPTATVTQPPSPTSSPTITTPPNYKQPDPDCVCQKVIGYSSESSTCKLCFGGLKPILELQAARDKLLSDLEKSKLRYAVFAKREDETILEMAKLRDSLEEKEVTLAAKCAELEAAKADLVRMGEKLMDAMEAKSELQASKEAVQDELEDLTKLLFEEANNLVAKEARIRHEHEKREKSLEKQLIDVNQQLIMEQAQLKELRLLLEKQNLSDPSSTGFPDRPNSINTVAQHPDSIDNMAITLQDAIDPLLLADFESFLQQSGNVKTSKLHSLLFMKNAIVDDIEPCLRFGGNPKVSFTKLLDAIAKNSCFVEELSPAQIAAMQVQRTGGTLPSNIQIPISPDEYQMMKQISGSTVDSMDPWGPKPPPTFALFNKTVIERISRWGGITGTTTPTTTPQTSQQGCSTCGRTGVCRYQFKVSELENDIWCPICSHCRDRLVAVCEFYNFVRHIRQGLYASRIVGELFVEVMSLKRKMFYSRIGCLHPIMFNERGWAKIRMTDPGQQPRLSQASIVAESVESSANDGETFVEVSIP
ncbi:Guanine nucleotide exchange factor (GEF) which may activate RAB8A and RAB8B [Nowakowskiella sp. JEL0407]|nr:Guanine nucleotide exchange factor (GEF) which may activate RAB8A and RAB8B [Nowakowskiella sp. JEL0407]